MFIYLLSELSFVLAQNPTDEYFNKQSDSLWKLYRNANNDTTRIKILNDEIATLFKYVNPDSAIVIYQNAVDIADKNLKQKNSDNNTFYLLKASSLRYIGNVYINNANYEQAMNYYLKALKLNQQIKNQKGISSCLTNIGIVNSFQGFYDIALEYYSKALKINEALGSKNELPLSYINIGVVYDEMGQFDKAIEFYLKALKIDEESDNKKRMSVGYTNIGVVYRNQGSLDKALEYQTKALKINEALNDKKEISKSYSNIGNIYYSLEDFNKALDFYSKSLKINEEINDIYGLSASYTNIGNVYWSKGEYDNVVDYYLKALKIKEELGDMNGVALLYLNLANLQISLSDSAALSENQRFKYLNKAIDFGTKSYNIAKDINAVPLINSAANSLMTTYKKEGNFKKSLEFSEIFIATTDSMFSEEKTKSLAEMGAKYESEKRELTIQKLEKEKELQDETIARKNAESKKQKILIFSFLAGFIIILVFSVFLYRLFIQKKKANIIIANKNESLEIAFAEINTQKEEITAQRDEIEAQRDKLSDQNHILYEQKKEITDSINYAKKIQQAVLPPDEHLQMFLTDFFILFRPKDIVSGDFYWATIIKQWQILTVADCTGHGVPGAFMSMLGVSFLNEIVRKQEVTKSSHVLNQLRESIIESLKQTGESGTQKDGMDMALAVINIETNLLQFSGANNPLWIIKSPKSQDKNSKPQEIETPLNSLDLGFEACFLELKADKMPIAIYERMDEFTNHELQLQIGDTIYLMSDGYEDQFGGLKGKKFLSKNLKQLLIANCQLSMFKQKEILEKTLENWIGDGEQIDDITVLGLRI
ncbi:MAG: hypothetical protein A2033_00205 [Bacteroidetes bacterium GWA2_31_9]|nr:MAG: hypothetical protein A2033_00205 [Bacteroidetes bacterium GWA2_31_9]